MENSNNNSCGGGCGGCSGCGKNKKEGGFNCWYLLATGAILVCAIGLAVPLANFIISVFK